MIAGASVSRLVHYAVVGAIAGTAGQLIVNHSYVESTLRPARAAMVSDTEIGDYLPRSRPAFATWTTAAMLGWASHLPSWARFWEQCWTWPGMAHFWQC